MAHESDPGNRRQWLAVAGLVLAAVAVLPPLETLARRYLFAESIQFCVLAMATPALIVLGAPWVLRSGRARGAGSQAHYPGSGPCLPERLAVGRQGRPSFARATGFLAAWAAVALFWRLPPVLDALARHPAILLPELVTVAPAGVGLWLELVHSPPFAPRLARPQRAFIAALAMWSIWAIAYVLGFATGSVVHGYDGAGSSLPTVADQEITAGLLWALSAACFIPVVFVALITSLRD